MRNEREVIAHHESAHCIASYILGCQPLMMTIDFPPRVEHAICDDAKSVAAVLYAGPAAATRSGGHTSLAGSVDMEMLMHVVSRLPTEVAEGIPRMARDLVDEHWTEIEELARVILLHGTLQGDVLARELARICKASSRELRVTL